MKKLLSIRNQFLDLLYVDNGKPFARSRKKKTGPCRLIAAGSLHDNNMSGDT
jgi:hypothetical protein